MPGAYMVELEDKNNRSTAPAEAIKSAVADAVASGMGNDEIQSMVQTALPDNLANFEELVPVYNKTPEGMIDLASAMEKYGYSRQLLNLWLQKGKLQRVGLLNTSVSHRDIPLFKESDLDTARSDLPEADRVYAELPDGLITVPAAVKKYGYNRNTLHSWVRKGHVESKGKLRTGHGVGGGSILISVAELLAFSSPPKGETGHLLDTHN